MRTWMTLLIHDSLLLTFDLSLLVSWKRFLSGKVETSPAILRVSTIVDGSLSITTPGVRFYPAATSGHNDANVTLER